MTLAEIVSVELNRTGHSRRWLARKIGVSPQTINNLVNGLRPDLVTVWKLSQFLREPIGLLLNAASLATSMEITDDRVVTVADDWPTTRTLRLLRALPHEDRMRVLRIVELFMARSESPS